VKRCGQGHPADCLIQGQVFRHLADASAQFAVFFQRDKGALFLLKSRIILPEQRCCFGFEILPDGISGKSEEYLLLRIGQR